VAFLYDIVFSIFVVFYIPIMLWKKKWHSGMKIRFGAIPPKLRSAFQSAKPKIWVHAVSVGEVRAIAILIKQIKEKCSEYEVVCSTVTSTGYQFAQETLGDTAVVFYAPIDFSWIVRKYIDLIKPKVYIAAETEIWPNIFTELKRQNVPIVMVNGRISDQAFRKYYFIRSFVKRILGCVDVFCMQSQIESQRIQELGAEPKRIRVVGNLKFDQSVQSGRLNRKGLGIEEDEDVWIAGSTHPGEEELIVQIYKELKQDFPKLRLILAPRHIERTDEILGLFHREYIEAIRFSRLPLPQKMKDAVIVVDTIGHLSFLYEMATVVFVGKSLVGQGGQNVIEPAAFGKPVIVGPNMENFREAMEMLTRARAVFQVRDDKQLKDVLVMLLKNEEKREAYGERARAVCQEQRGALTQTLSEVQKVLLREKE